MSAGAVPRGLGALRRLAEPKPPAAPAPEPVERCEMCGVEVPEEHGHVADTQDHRLLCVCRPCHLLFGPDGAGGARYRGVGGEPRRVEGLDLTDAHWDSLQVPVDLAFFFRQGADGFVAFYPGPSGATESTLDLDDWSEILTRNPVLSAVQSDVEAVLLRRVEPTFRCYVVPVDRCYELVGLVRAHWVGLAGGAEVWELIEAFFDDLDTRSAPVARTG